MMHTRGYGTQEAINCKWSLTRSYINHCMAAPGAIVSVRASSPCPKPRTPATQAHSLTLSRVPGYTAV